MSDIANKILFGDVEIKLKEMEPGIIQTCVTSPPYWGLRDYGVEGQIGLEETPEQYIEKMVQVFREVWRVLRDDGTLWLNLGDSYCGSRKGAWDKTDVQKEVYVPDPNGRAAKIPKIPNGLKAKNLVGIPWRVALALQADGWYLRQDIIWHKPNPMPESVTDRCTKSHEYIFLLSKAAKYYYDNEAIKEPAQPDNSIRDRDNTRLNNTPGRTKMQGLKVNTYETRNKRSVWTVTTKPYSGAHFATFPEELIEPCILAGSKIGDIVLDPFMGSGTTAAVAKKTGRRYAGVELNEKYKPLQDKRIRESVYQYDMFRKNK